MKTKIIEGVELTQGAVDSYLKDRQYNALYWATFFPRKDVAQLSATTLIGSKGSRIAAAVISYNAKTPEAGRKTITKKSFDIPKIAIKRIKTESEILEQRMTLAMLGANAVIADYFEDVDYVYDAVNGRQEWFALQALSLTKIQLSTTNNPNGIVNETVVDFGMPDANKKVVSVVWTSGTLETMDPIADFKAVAKAGRALGLKFSKMLMHPDAFDLMTGATKFQAYFKNTALNVVAGMSLENINTLLRSLSLPEIVVIETSVGIENKAGVTTEVNPWDANHITFITEVKQGNMFNGPIAEEIEKPLDVMQSKRDNVLISIKKEFDPVSVITKGEANAFPSWPMVDRCMSLYLADASTWA